MDLHEEPVPYDPSDPERYGPDYVPGHADPGAAVTPPPAPEPPRVRAPHGRRLTAVLAVGALVAAGVTAGGLLAGGSAGGGGHGTLPVATVHASTVELSPSQAAAAVAPALVDVDTVVDYGQARAAGTGIVLNPDGLVLTNNHVVEGSTHITVRDIGNGQDYPAAVVGYDRSHDIAVLQLSGASGLATASLDPNPVTVGEPVVGVGNAGGRGGPPSTAAGAVTAVHRTAFVRSDSGAAAEHLADLIQTNADIQPGDSGGALVDRYGQVVGVDTAASSTNGTSSAAPVGLAIPIGDALGIAQQISTGSASPTVHLGQTAFLGVELAQGIFSLGAPAAGVPVAGVVPGTTAAALGLRSGDVITKVDGRPVSSAAGIGAIIGTAHVGDQVHVDWITPAGTPQQGSAALQPGPIG